MKYLTHWMTAFITLFFITYLGLQDFSFKETLRLKSFDYLLANEEKSQSQDITIITIRRTSDREVWSMDMVKRLLG